MIDEVNRGVPADMLDDLVAPVPVAERGLTGKLVQYGVAAVGPIAAAATQFLLSLVMLRLLSPHAFGTLTLLLVVSQLSWSVWSALFCSPLPVVMAVEGDRMGGGEMTIIAASTTAAIASVTIFGGLAFWFGLPLVAGACFAAYGCFALLRWFARSYAYVHGRQIRTMLSDVTYSGTVLAALAIILVVMKIEAERACYIALLAGAFVAMIPFGRGYAVAIGSAVIRHGVMRYGTIWRDHARWALLGVVTTEATTNAHVYLITLLQGPVAFAPIAAASLLVRPVNVAQNALADFERPQMARLIGAQAWTDLSRSLRFFRLALAMIWIGTFVLGLILFATSPRLIFPKSYDLNFLIVAAFLWGCVAALRLIQTPDSTMLQAAGAFQPLAMASVWSSFATVSGVVLLVLVAGTLASMGGLVIGAAIFWYWTWRYAKKWLDQRRGGD